MTTTEILGALLAVPLLAAAYADWRWEHDRRRCMPVATMRSIPLRPNRRR